MATGSYHEPHPHRAAQDQRGSPKQLQRGLRSLVGQSWWIWDLQPSMESPNVGHICCHTKVPRHHLWLCHPAQGLTIVLVYLWFFSLPCLLVETLFPLVCKGNCVTPKRRMKVLKRALPDGTREKKESLWDAVCSHGCELQPRLCCAEQEVVAWSWPRLWQHHLLLWPQQCIRSPVQLHLNRISQPKQMPAESLQYLYDVTLWVINYFYLWQNYKLQTTETQCLYQHYCL